jgi:hypothetical protein
VLEDDDADFDLHKSTNVCNEHGRRKIMQQLEIALWNHGNTLIQNLQTSRKNPSTKHVLLLLLLIRLFLVGVAIPSWLQRGFWPFVSGDGILKKFIFMPKKPDKLFEAFAREQQRNSNNNKEKMRNLASFFITREQQKNKNRKGRNKNLASFCIARE